LQTKCAGLDVQGACPESNAGEQDLRAEEDVCPYVTILSR